MTAWKMAEEKPDDPLEIGGGKEKRSRNL